MSDENDKTYEAPTLRHLGRLNAEARRKAAEALAAGDIAAVDALIDRGIAPTLEKCHGCMYEGEALSARCEFHAANPDETTHVGFAGALAAAPLEQLELAIEREPYEAPSLREAPELAPLFADLELPEVERSAVVADDTGEKGADVDVAGHAPEE